MAQASWRALRLVLAFAAVAAFMAGGAASSGAEGSLESATLQTLDQTGGAVMIELEGAPSAIAYADARKLGASKADAGQAGKAAKNANDQAQSSVLAAINSTGIDATPLYQVQTAYNGIAVQAAPGTLSELAALPGVKAVHEIPLVTLDNHS